MGNLGMELNLENTWKWEDGKVSKFKVGDKVRVVSYLNDEIDPEVGVVDSMLRMRGKTATISKVTGSGCYEIKEDDDGE